MPRPPPPPPIPTLAAALAPPHAPAPPVASESLPQGFVLLVRDESGAAGPDRPLHLACNFNAWNPADPEWRLAPQPDGRWRLHITAPSPDDRMEFKFTLGGWDREELDAAGGVIANRTLPAVEPPPGAEPPVIELSIPRFREASAPPPPYDPLDPAHVTGDLRTLAVTGGGGEAASLTRDLLIWLPPGYDEPANRDRAYPVLYLFDGQNLFNPAPGVAGEWHVDETLTRLVEEGRVEPLIVVGIPHAGTMRISEYLPMGPIPGVRPAGRACMAWVLGTVMPAVEAAFRVSTDPADTGIGGSSLGGLMAMLAATEHADRFGRALIESPSLLLGDGAEVRAHAAGAPRWSERVVVGMGGREAGGDARRNAQYTAWARDLDAAIAATGIADDARLLQIDETARHTESAWAQRFGPAVEFLFPADP